MHRIFRLSLQFGLLAPLFIIFAFQPATAGETGSSSDVTLRWSPKQGSTYVYRVSTTGTHGERITGRTEDFTLTVDSVADGKVQFIATGEPVPDSAPLAYRFQRALFPVSRYTIDFFGNTEAAPGQPYPLFLNIPIFPDGPVSVGSKWTGGPVGIIPDINVGPIPFSFTSTYSSVSTYLQEECVVIDTDYKVALPPDAKSLMPFLGLVEGDTPKEPGHGAPIGGVVENSRAHKADIQAGDLIVEVEGQRIRGWGGLKEILPLLVPEKPIKFRVSRAEKEFDVEIAPEGVPLVSITGVGGLHSICYFSTGKGIPLKIDLASTDLVFTLANAQGETEERPASMHITMEYQHGGPGANETP